MTKDQAAAIHRIVERDVGNVPRDRWDQLFFGLVDDSVVVFSETNECVHFYAAGGTTEVDVAIEDIVRVAWTETLASST